MRQLDETADCGIIFAATGDVYRKLARRAARNVREVMPDVPIDLFTDVELDDPVFSRIHRLDRSIRSPKMGALLHSRFRRTLYLDSDIVVMQDLSDIFALLEKADFVGAHEQYGSSPVSMQIVRHKIPAAFRQINGGVIGFRVSDRIERFLAHWRSDFETLKLQYDQPILRELLYDCDYLKVFVLPQEYNQMHPAFVRAASDLMMAPRIMHLTRLHVGDQHTEPADQPFDLGKLIPKPAAERYNQLVKSDRTLGARRNTRTLVAETLRRSPFAYRMVRKIRNFFA